MTIADVAAEAGVGVGTVSRVLNGSGQVGESTLRTVLDYRSHPALYRPVRTWLAQPARPARRPGRFLAAQAEFGAEQPLKSVAT